MNGAALKTPPAPPPLAVDAAPVAAALARRDVPALLALCGEAPAAADGPLCHWHVHDAMTAETMVTHAAGLPGGARVQLVPAMVSPQGIAWLMPVACLRVLRPDVQALLEPSLWPKDLLELGALFGAKPW